MPQKPAVILDDSPEDVVPLARGLRVFGGVETKHFFSIPAFERENNLQLEPNNNEKWLKEVAEVLKKYSVIVSDNNFEEHTDPAHPYDGYARGIDFLTGVVGPALQLLSPEERPLVVCFAPSSHESIDDNRERLEKMGIIAFHKIEQSTLIGLYMAVSQEYKLPLSYREFIHDILGFEEDNMRYGEKGYRFGFELGYEHLHKSFKDEGDGNIVAGPPRPLPWKKLKNDISSRLGLPVKQFDLRIEAVAALHRREGYGQINKK
ncbi:hypothetical protein HZC27_05435 [Candidatus Roizmanbacteria bacterium]|nr:hypothetical protein [Candidatus Roizmanbacteria bacterium]